MKRGRRKRAKRDSRVDRLINTMLRAPIAVLRGPMDELVKWCKANPRPGREESERT